nr:MAG TPA: hypothetical protein [Caudoviricetes sp.]
MINIYQFDISTFTLIGVSKAYAFLLKIIFPYNYAAAYNPISI